MKMLLPVASVVEQAARDGLRDAGKQLLKASNAKAPVDDRDLIKSGRVKIDDLTMRVHYTAVHATFQHERLDYEHADGGQAKFLESAANEVAVDEVLAKHARKALGGE